MASARQRNARWHKARAQCVCPLRPAINFSTLCSRFVVESNSQEHHLGVFAIFDVKECIAGMWGAGFRNMSLPGRILVGGTTNAPRIHDDCSAREPHEIWPMAVAENKDSFFDRPQAPDNLFHRRPHQNACRNVVQNISIIVSRRGMKANNAGGKLQAEGELA